MRDSLPGRRPSRARWSDCSSWLYPWRRTGCAATTPPSSTGDRVDRLDRPSGRLVHLADRAAAQRRARLRRGYPRWTRADQQYRAGRTAVAGTPYRESHSAVALPAGFHHPGLRRPGDQRAGDPLGWRRSQPTVAFVYTLFGTAITRSWELIGLEGGGPLDLLARRLGAREPLNSEPAEQDPEPGPR
jgi:hypothetical protein